MEEPKDHCPAFVDGRHNYFIYRIVTEYEPIDKRAYSATQTEAGMNMLKQFYEKVEYAISGCKCGRATKSRVRDGDDI